MHKLSSFVVRTCNLLQQIKIKGEAKFKFQGQYSRSQIQFYLDLDWIDINFSTCEPDFYKKLFQSHDDTQVDITFKTFQVPIGNAKCVKSFKFQNDAPILKYCKKSVNSCCFSSLASALDSNKNFKAANDISMRIEETLNIEVGNRIDYANDIIKRE